MLKKLIENINIQIGYTYNDIYVWGIFGKPVIMMNTYTTKNKEKELMGSTEQSALFLCGNPALKIFDLPLF